MRKIIYTICALAFLGSSSLNAQFLKDLQKAIEKEVPGIAGTASGVLSEDEVGQGLKAALFQGVEKGVKTVSKPDGYFKDPLIKILMPDEVKKVEEKLRVLGMGQYVDKAVLSMNRAAEDAAVGAKDIFVDAIKQLTLQDVMGILNGEKDAATKYLSRATRVALTNKFQPVIKTSLDKVNATSHWNSVFSNYNKVPFVKKVNPDLEKYVTDKAIDGLFKQVAKEELEIRQNPAARGSEILQKVFGKK